MEKIKALTFDIQQDGWEASRGFGMRQVDFPELDENKRVEDAQSVVIQMQFAGVCGTDKNIFNRAAFKDLIASSLAAQGKTTRILGHELCGKVVQVGSKVANVNVGDMVSGDSHVTCGECLQCRIGQNNVCANEGILGVSLDGVFAPMVKLPAKNLWKVSDKIRPEIAAIMDPFGNAVHAAGKVNMKDKTVAIFGVGAIGLFCVLLARHFGAKTIIVADVEAKKLDLAKSLGADAVILLCEGVDVSLEISKLTRGIGADICLEMAGPNASVNNAIASVRRGGDVILFGLKDGDFVLPKFSQIITRGITLHGIIGRRIFETWNISQDILTDQSNGVQEKIWNVVMAKGRGTVLDFNAYDNNVFIKAMDEYPKIIFKLS